jgi:hypothetical protein
MGLKTSSANITLSTDSVIQSSANDARRALIVQVKSGGTATIKFDNNITTDTTGFNDGIVVVGQLILDRFCPTGQIYMLGSVAGVLVTLTEVLEV